MTGFRRIAACQFEKAEIGGEAIDARRPRKLVSERRGWKEVFGRSGFLPSMRRSLKAVRPETLSPF